MFSFCISREGVPFTREAAPYSLLHFKGGRAIYKGGRLALLHFKGGRAVHKGVWRSQQPRCGEPLARYQATHPRRERGTTVAAWPSDAQLIAQARALLAAAPPLPRRRLPAASAPRPNAV